MKFFGAYLVDQGIINQRQLIDALIEQAAQMPPMVKVASECGVFSDEDFLNILDIQNRDSVSFLVALERSGLQTNEIVDTLRTTAASQTPPLGQILILNKVIDFSTLSGALDEYMVEFADDIKDNREDASNESVTEPVPEQPKAAAPVEAVEEIQEVEEVEEVGDASTPGHEDVPEEHIGRFQFARVEPSLVGCYTNVFDNNKRFSLEDNIQKLEKDIVKFDNYANVLLSEFATGKSGARFIRAGISVYLYSLAEELLRSITQGPGVFSVDDVAEVQAILIDIIEEIWNVRQNLHASGTEEFYWRTADSRQRFHRIEQNVVNKAKDYGHIFEVTAA